jgi:3-isopropylmalate dehydrogenase
MMLDHIGEGEKAKQIRTAIAKVIEDGKVKSYDMMKIRGGASSIEQGAATTQQVTDAIIAAL